MTAADKFVANMAGHVRWAVEEDMLISTLDMIADKEFIRLTVGIAEMTDHNEAMAELPGLVSAYHEVKDDYSKLYGGDAE